MNQGSSWVGSWDSSRVDARERLPLLHGGPDVVAPGSMSRPS